MKRVDIAASVVVPAMFFAQASLSLSMLQTGGILDFLRPAMPVLSDVLGFFGNLLIPLGQFFGTLLQGPLKAISDAIPAQSPAGYALYFLIFAGILVVALILNVVWRPLGYATADSRAKREAKEARAAEREEARDAAKAEKKARHKGAKKEAAEKGKEIVPEKAEKAEKAEKVEEIEVIEPTIVSIKEPEKIDIRPAQVSTPPSETFVDHGNDPDQRGEKIGDDKGKVKKTTEQKAGSDDGAKANTGEKKAE